MANQLAMDKTFSINNLGDAGYTIPAVMDALVAKDGRLKTDAKLAALAAEHLARPPGRPPEGGYETTVELGPLPGAFTSKKPPSRSLTVTARFGRT